MPVLKRCSHPGCNKLLPLGTTYCPKHTPMHQVKSPDWLYLYKTPEWRMISKNYLIEHPYCAECGDLATDVHHRIPHRGNPEIFWDTDNLIALCKRCHKKHTNQEIANRNKRDPY